MNKNEIAEINSNLPEIVKDLREKIYPLCFDKTSLAKMTPAAIKKDKEKLQAYLIKMVEQSNFIANHGDMEANMNSPKSPLKLIKGLVSEIEGLKSSYNRRYDESKKEIFELLNYAVETISAHSGAFQQKLDKERNDRVEKRKKSVETLMKSEGYNEEQIASYITSSNGVKMITNKSANLDNLSTDIEDYKRQIEEENSRRIAQAKIAEDQLRAAEANRQKMNNQKVVESPKGKTVTRIIKIDETRLAYIEEYIKTYGGEIY